MRLREVFSPPRWHLARRSRDGSSTEIVTWSFRGTHGEQEGRMRAVGLDLEQRRLGLKLTPDRERHCHLVFGGGPWNRVEADQGWPPLSDTWYRCEVQADLPDGVAQLYCLGYGADGQLTQKRCLGNLEHWSSSTVYRFRVPAGPERFALALYLPSGRAPSSVTLRALSLNAFVVAAEDAADPGAQPDLPPTSGIATGAQRSSEYYDLHTERDVAPLEASPWRELYRVAASFLPPPQEAPAVVDIGCGTGRFAELLRRNRYSNYVGIDFAPARVEHARSYVPRFQFEQMDAFGRAAKRLFARHRLFVILEMLEHVDRDLELIERLPSGATVVLSVPNYPSAGHVRHFSDLTDARARYSRHIEFTADATVTIDEQAGRTIFVLRGRRR